MPVGQTVSGSINSIPLTVDIVEGRSFLDWSLLFCVIRRYVNSGVCTRAPVTHHPVSNASPTFCALSLRNLFPGYEFGRVFPAGVGPGPPSRGAANWLPSRLGLSVETWRRYGSLRMVFPGVRPFRAPISCTSGGWRHARGRERCRGEPGSAVSGGYAPDSAKLRQSPVRRDLAGESKQYTQTTDTDPFRRTTAQSRK